MILKINQNTPVAAPQFNDMNAALVVYRVFTGQSLYVMSDFLAFITRPSADRAEFLKLFSVTVTVMNNKYAKQIYS